MSVEVPADEVRRRRRLSPERKQELFQAVVDLLREDGYEMLSMERVAARTKSSKATLYRQWNTKPQLVAAALRATKTVTLETVDTGSLAGDLRGCLRQIGAGSMRDTALMQSLGHAIRKDPELRREVREVLVQPELDVLDDIVHRAVERGEVSADHPALDFLADALMGSMTARPLLSDEYADSDYLERFLDAIILPALRRT